MSRWKQNAILQKITDILALETYPHHFGGRPFLAAYPLAAAFAERYPAATAALGYPIGGSGTGKRMTLARYLANMLSRGIKGGAIGHIEGAFLSNSRLKDILFDSKQGIIASTLTQTQNPLSMFRIKENADPGGAKGGSDEDMVDEDGTVGGEVMAV